MMYNFNDFNGLADVYASYDRYARTAEMEGKKPVSLLKFALGNF